MIVDKFEVSLPKFGINVTFLLSPTLAAIQGSKMPPCGAATNSTVGQDYLLVQRQMKIGAARRLLVLQ